jgi:hypothetical protein
MVTMIADEDTFLKEKIFDPVAKRVMDGADSLLHLAKFPRSGIEGWLKVEAVRALADLVRKLQNKGPDLQLIEDFFVELKGATECNQVGILDVLKKYQADPRYRRLACLFIGSGSNIPRCINYWNANARVLAYERFSVGTDDWIVGLIVPQDR